MLEGAVWQIHSCWAASFYTIKCNEKMSEEKMSMKRRRAQGTEHRERAGECKLQISNNKNQPNEVSS